MLPPVLVNFAVLTTVLGAFHGGKSAAIASPSKAYSLATTLIEVVLILIATRHTRRMIAWVNADEFDATPATELPDQPRVFIIACAAVALGVVSFEAVLALR